MKGLFIVGYWNSGTTLLVDLLRKHPQLQLRRSLFKPNIEERTIVKILRRFGQDFIDLGDEYKDIIANGFANYKEASLNETDKAAFLKIFQRKFSVSNDKTLLLKNPWLFFMPNFLAETFAKDDIKKIIIIRDGAQQVVSKDYWQSDTENPEQKLYARAKFWVRSMEYYFEHWHERKDTLTIRYENLCADPISTLKEICQFIELNSDWEALNNITPLSIKNKNWDALDKVYQANVMEIVDEMQRKIDEEVSTLTK